MFMRLGQPESVLLASLDIQRSRADVRPFLRNPGALDIWSMPYFDDLAKRMVFA
jgi:hypothetical protein